MSTQYTSCCCTIYTDQDNPPVFREDKMSYLIYQYEECPTTLRNHWQVYVEFTGRPTKGGIYKIFNLGKDFWLDYRKGTALEAAEYCKKAKSRILMWQEFGQISHQGERTDLKLLALQVAEGSISTAELMTTRPHDYHIFGRTVDQIENLRMRNNIMMNEPKVDRFYGTKKEWALFVKTKVSEGAYFHRGSWSGYSQNKLLLLNTDDEEMVENVTSLLPYYVKIHYKMDIPVNSLSVVIYTGIENPEYTQDNIEKLIENLKRKQKERNNSDNE